MLRIDLLLEFHPDFMGLLLSPIENQTLLGLIRLTFF
jgi:hypothetical protein